MSSQAAQGEDWTSTGSQYPLKSSKDLLSRSFSCCNGSGDGKMDTRDTDWDFHSSGRAWGRPESVWAEYLFTWNPLLAEIEAMDACQWLKDAGFPQYAQMYREGHFPIDLEMARRDHRFLDEDALEAVFRRLKLLNKCSANKQLVTQTADQQQEQEQPQPQQQQQQQQPGLSNQIDESEEDDDDLCCAALTDTWTYQRNSRQWCRRESPCWETQNESTSNKSAGQNYSYRDSPHGDFLQRDFQNLNSPRQDSLSNLAQRGSMTKSRSTPTRSTDLVGTKKPSFLFEGDLLVVSSSSKDSVIVDESSGSSPSSFRSDDRERIFEPSTALEFNSKLEVAENSLQLISKNEDPIESTTFQRAKVLSGAKNYGQSSRVSAGNSLAAVSLDKRSVNSNTQGMKGERVDLENMSQTALDEFIQSEINSCNVSENDLEISAEISENATKSEKSFSMNSGASQSVHHARSKSATVGAALKRKTPENLLPVSVSKTSPCGSDISVTSEEKTLDKSLSFFNMDQSFQRNTPITGSGRIRMALMKKMESLSGKKKKALIKAKDIGEPTVVESEKLRVKLESLGCVNISPSPSSTGDKDKMEKIFQFDLDTTEQLSGRPSPVTQNLARFGSSSLPATPSLDQLDEVLERLRICEESIGQNSSCSKSARECGEKKINLEQSQQSKSEFCRTSDGDKLSLQPNGGNAGFCRAFNNIYRSSKKYTEPEKVKMLTSANLSKFQTKTSEREQLGNSDENVPNSNQYSSFTKINRERINTVPQNNELFVSPTAGVILSRERGSFESSALNAEFSSEKKLNGGLSTVDSPASHPTSKPLALRIGGALPSSASGSNITWKERLQMSHSQTSPAGISDSSCVSPTTELDSILDELYRNIDSLTTVRSKSLEPESSKNTGWTSGPMPEEGYSGSKTKVAVTKSTDSAFPSDASNSTESTLERKGYLGGSLRKPNLHTNPSWQQCGGASTSASKSNTSTSSNVSFSNSTSSRVIESGRNGDSNDKYSASAKETKENSVNKAENNDRSSSKMATNNFKSCGSSPTTDFKLSVNSNGAEDVDSLNEKSGGTTSHDEGSQNGLEGSVWDHQSQLTPDTKDPEEDDDWTYAEGHRMSERRDSGIGSPLTKGRRQQKRARIRWHSFARSHRVSVSSHSRQISSLSAGQLVVLRKLSLLKLTATIEKYSNVQLSSKNWLLPLQTKKSKSTELAALSRRVFGLPLTAVQQRHGQPLPECILRAMRHLRRTANSAEGIFRKSGVKSRVMALRDSVESNPDGVDFSEHSAYDVADLLKLYLRELPDCLLTNKLSHVFIAIMQSNIPEEVSIDLLTAAVLLLPDEHRETLACLLLFLNDMSAYSHQNQMNATNLAICFAPAVFNLYALKGGMTSSHSRKDRNRSLSPGGGSSRGRRGNGLPGEKDLAEQKSAQLCLTLLISNAKNIFMVSEELIGGCRLTYIELGDPVSLSELCGRHDGNISTYIDSCIQGLLKESRDKFKGWVTAPYSNSAAGGNSDVELKFKKVGDGHPLRLWKWQAEVEASPPDVLQRVLRERHIWDPDLIRWRVAATLDSHTEIFQYAVATMAPHPARDFCELRSWRSDLPRGACVLVSTSVEHPEAPLSDGAVRGVVLASRYLIEPCPGAAGKSRLTQISRVDIRGHSLEWYNSVYCHLAANQALAIRDSFLTNHKPACEGGPETVV